MKRRHLCPQSLVRNVELWLPEAPEMMAGHIQQELGTVSDETEAAFYHKFLLMSTVSVIM